MLLKKSSTGDIITSMLNLRASKFWEMLLVLLNKTLFLLHLRKLKKNHIGQEEQGNIVNIDEDRPRRGARRGGARGRGGRKPETTRTDE